MADIIDFRVKAKPYRKSNLAQADNTEYGKIILFSGVRIVRDEMPNIDTQIDKSVEFLNSKSN